MTKSKKVKTALKVLKFIGHADYPADLASARRDEFVKAIQDHNSNASEMDQASKNEGEKDEDDK